MLCSRQGASAGWPQLDPQQPQRIIELRFFTGLSIEETARALNILCHPVKREWTTARACY